MTRSTKNWAVLFADICDSTKLYSTLGDVAARAVVDDCLSLIGTVVTRCHGRVIKTIGDEAMCVFPHPDDAVQAACMMQLDVGANRPGGHVVRLHLGLHYGPVLVEHNDVFGDTVNSAAYLTAAAAPDQILTTAAVEQNLSPALRTSVRPAFRAVLKGSDRESTVYQVIWHNDTAALTDINLRSHDRTLPTDEGSLLVSYRGNTIRMDQAMPSLTVGRGSGCDLVLTEKLASRNHFSIRLLRTHYYLLDTSLNGTFVTMENGDEVHVLRSELMLGGSGKIAVGRTLDEGAEPITFVRDRRSMYRK